jgi:hypothetical protein
VSLLPSANGLEIHVCDVVAPSSVWELTMSAQNKPEAVHDISPFVNNVGGLKGNSPLPVPQPLTSKSPRNLP